MENKTILQTFDFILFYEKKQKKPRKKLNSWKNADWNHQKVEYHNGSGLNIVNTTKQNITTNQIKSKLKMVHCNLPEK